jgi:hypothetical protein
MPSEGIAAAIAHNISPAVFLKHYRAIRDAETEHKSTGSAVQTAKKAAKSDGVNLDALRLLTKLNKLDSDEAELQLKHMITYAGWAGLPLGSQLDMFGGKTTTEVPEDEAEKQREFNATEEGKRASEGGQPRDSNPHADAGSPEFAAWDKAWLKANRKFMKQQQAVAEEMGANAGVTTSRRRRNGSAATAH